MASRRVGEGRSGEAAVPLNGGLLLAVAIGVPWAVALFAVSSTVLPLLLDDPRVVELGTPYLQARMLGLAAIAVNVTFRGFWNGTDRPGLYLRTIVTQHVCNVVLNYVLIYGHFGFPALGAAGSGVATTLALTLSTVHYLFLGLKHARPQGFLRGLPDRTTLATMVRLALPASLHQGFVSAGLSAFFWVVSQIGTAEAAATHVVLTLFLVGLLPGLGFGMAAMSLVGQALGRREPEDARRWGWDVAKIAFLGVTAISLPGIVAPEVMLRLFIHEDTTVALAIWPLRLVALTLGTEAIGIVLMQALLGAGDNRRVVAITTLMQWGIFLPLCYLLGPHLGLGMLPVWIANVVYRQAQMVVFVLLWKRSAWAHIRV
jgi:putative MATE family efflux protein